MSSVRLHAYQREKFRHQLPSYTCQPTDAIGAHSSSDTPAAATYYPLVALLPYPQNHYFTCTSCFHGKLLYCFNSIVSLRCALVNLIGLSTCMMHADLGMSCLQGRPIVSGRKSKGWPRSPLSRPQTIASGRVRGCARTRESTNKNGRLN